MAAERTGDPAPQDELRRKFKEALDRKNGRHADKATADESQEQGKIHDAHGPAHSQRQFRRKSGG
jgi:Family of unknown function (DUF5302)